MRKKSIMIVFTGGTISMHKHESTFKTVINDNQNELLKILESNIPHVELLSHQFSMKPSPAVTPGDMFNLAKLTNQYIENPNIDGVVITHGTDTLEETAYFLDLYLNTKKPVVVTGSMRNFSELGYDGLSNLHSSILVASSSESKNLGILVVLNDEINSAREVTKSHTMALDTFKSLEFGPLGIVDQERVIYYRNTHHHESFITPNQLSADVEIVKASAGSSSVLLNLLIDQKINGIIVEALGRGNVPETMVDGIKRAIKNNIPVIITSRSPMGRVLDTYGYEGGGAHLMSLGVIFAGNLNSQKARIKLILALSLTNDQEQIRKYFSEGDY
ncbi:MAG: asparaginase [Acholeplasmataceae bacterium]